MRIPQKFRRDQINVYSGIGNISLSDILKLVPNDIDTEKVYFDTEKTYLYKYDDTEYAIMNVYYYGDIENINYQKELEEYNFELEKEKFYEDNKKKYFSVDEIIYLPIGQKYFMEDIEIAPLKQQTQIKIESATVPISPNNNAKTNDNWCQIINFNMGGKEFKTILNNKDVLFRKKWD